MNTFLILDAFFIPGKGFILTCVMSSEHQASITVNDTIGIKGTGETYIITGIERSMYLMYPPRPSKNVSILVRGDLWQDKNWYSGKHIYKVEGEGQ